MKILKNVELHLLKAEVNALNLDENQLVTLKSTIEIELVKTEKVEA